MFYILWHLKNEIFSLYTLHSMLVRSNGSWHGKQLKNGENWIADNPDSSWHSEQPQVQPSKPVIIAVFLFN